MECLMMKRRPTHDVKKTYAGVRPVPRSIYDIRGRLDADLWMNACDKEVEDL